MSGSRAEGGLVAGGIARMGDVKVSAKLIAAIHPGMFHRGLLPHERLRSLTSEAAVDTGVIRSCVPVVLL